LQVVNELLLPEAENKTYLQAVSDRLSHLAYHVRNYYWLDLDTKSTDTVEEFGASMNWLNIYPATIQIGYLSGYRPMGGYLVGNLGPAWMDFRFFTQGTLLAIITSASKQSASDHGFDWRLSGLVGKCP